MRNVNLKQLGILIDENTRFYINYEECKSREALIKKELGYSFISTMRNVNQITPINSLEDIKGFILTMRNVNLTTKGMIQDFLMGFYINYEECK